MHPRELKTLRLALGLTQSELAAQLGVTRVFIGLMERGQKQISKRTVEGLKSVRAKQSLFDVKETDKIFRTFEIALIEIGATYNVRHDEDEDLAEYGVDFFPSKIIIARSSEGRKLSTTKDAIYLRGELAVNLFSDLIVRSGARIFADYKLTQTA